MAVKRQKSKPSYLQNDDDTSNHTVSVSIQGNSKKELKISQIIKKSDLEKSPIKLTEKQKQLIDIIDKNIITIIQGVAGTSKTLSAVYAGLKLLSEGKIKKIILTKSIIEANGENLGYLPGNQHDKVSPYLESYFNNFEKILDKFTIDLLRTSGLIEFKPIAYMRGSTFDNSLIILDEAQNTAISGLMLVCTRLGQGSKLIILGDVSQNDISRGDVKLTELSEMIEGLEHCQNFTFGKEDIKRSEFLIKLTERYEEYKDKLHSKKQLLKN